MARRAAVLRGASKRKMRPSEDPSSVSPCAAPSGDAKAPPPKAMAEKAFGAAPPFLRPSDPCLKRSSDS
eukprot:6816235-Prymnesium_polylepis.1